MKVGDKVRITKKTFLHKGVLVNTNSTAEIVDIDSDSITIAYLDREGGIHHIQLSSNDVQLEKEHAS